MEILCFRFLFPKRTKVELSMNYGHLSNTILSFAHYWFQISYMFSICIDIYANIFNNRNELARSGERWLLNCAHWSFLLFSHANRWHVVMEIVKIVTIFDDCTFPWLYIFSILYNRIIQLNNWSNLI